MITDQEITDLYRNLLGRDPENEGTVTAFKNYYPTLEQGRRAIFSSAEFEKYYARTTGRILNRADHAAASLALALLERASANAPVPPAPPPDDAVRTGMRRFFEADAPPRFAVAVGHPAGLRLDDLAPLGRPEAALLHVAPDIAAGLPMHGRLEDGTALFRLGGAPEAVAAFLADEGRRIDALYLLDANAGAHWVDRLRAHFTEQALIVIGRAQGGFDPHALDATIRDSHNLETRIDWQGLLISQVGGWLLPVTYHPAPAAPLPALDAIPKLAIAAIVWNEAVCIENMLRSVLPVASYYAVLDTGSTDGTPALARAWLAESGVPHTIAKRDRATEFGNDFSAMRNAALAMVPDDIDWVLMLDADEEMVSEDLAPLLQIIADAMPGQDCFALPRYNFRYPDKSGEVMAYPDLQLRLLRNTPDRRVRYTGAVHETVRTTPHLKLPRDASAIGASRGGPHIHHLVRRFRTSAEEERKQAFYRAIAAAEVAK